MNTYRIAELAVFWGGTTSVIIAAGYAVGQFMPPDEVDAPKPGGAERIGKTNPNRRGRLMLSLSTGPVEARRRQTQRNTARAQRSYLRTTLRVDAAVVAATPDADLNDLIWKHRAPQLELVPCVPVDDRMEPDEIACLMSVAQNRLVEPHDALGFAPTDGAA